MHILVITQYFWPENFRINDIVEGLHERGHRITVLTGHPNYPLGEFTHGYTGLKIHEEHYQGITVFRVPMLPRGRKSGIKLALNYASYAVSGVLFGILHRKENYDVILVYEPSPMTVGFPAMVMKWKTRRPIAFYIQDLWPESLTATGFITHPSLLRLVRSMVKLIYDSCDHILVTSRAFIPRVAGLGYPISKITYLPQYAEAFYSPRQYDPEWASSKGLPNGFSIVFAGNMGLAQDLFTVLEAARITQNDQIQWVFIGDGSIKEDLREKADAEKLKNVTFLDQQPPQSMPDLFAQASVLLVSLTANELFSLTVPAKLQSYLACGRPILASLHGEGAALVIESGAGLVVEPGQPENLASAARFLKSLDRSSLANMGKLGRAFFDRNFERESILSILENTLINLRKKS